MCTLLVCRPDHDHRHRRGRPACADLQLYCWFCKHVQWETLLRSLRGYWLRPRPGEAVVVLLLAASAALLLHLLPRARPPPQLLLLPPLPSPHRQVYSLTPTFTGDIEIQYCSPNYNTVLSIIDPNATPATITCADGSSTYLPPLPNIPSNCRSDSAALFRRVLGGSRAGIAPS